MHLPAPFPTTSAPEQDAVTTFLTLIDSRYVKPNIRTLDKVPNHDGTIELVDDHGYPIGMLQIQIRKIGTDETKCQCEVGLVAYAQQSTSLPFILVGADPATKKGYWKQLHSEMPEYKEDQQSFTIHFDQASDSIDTSLIYLQKWADIARYYRERIANYPKLRKELLNKPTLEGIPADDIRFFQQFIDDVNYLLDYDFISVKNAVFPGVNKLGVGVGQCDEQSVLYQIYVIPNNETGPLVCKVEKDAFDLQKNRYAVSATSSTRERLAEPQTEATRYVLQHVRNIVQHKALPIHGVLLSKDILFEFIDEFADCLALLPDQDVYSVSDISRGLTGILLGLCAVIVNNSSESSKRLILLDLDTVANIVRQNGLKPTNLRDTAVRFALGSRRLSMRSVSDAIRYLTANNISTIERPFARRSRSGHWIWSVYAEEDAVHNIELILENSIQEYASFVTGNRLKLPNSPYLDPNVSIIYEYEPFSIAAPGEEPGISEYHVANPLRQMPKVAVYVKRGEDKKIGGDKFPIITINGVVHHASFQSIGTADFLFYRTPVLNMVYRMLKRDLEKHYPIGAIP